MPWTRPNQGCNQGCIGNFTFFILPPSAGGVAKNRRSIVRRYCVHTLRYPAVRARTMQLRSSFSTCYCVSNFVTLNGGCLYPFSSWTKVETANSAHDLASSRDVLRCCLAARTLTCGLDAPLQLLELHRW